MQQAASAPHRYTSKGRRQRALSQPTSAFAVAQLNLEPHSNHQPASATGSKPVLVRRHVASHIPFCISTRMSATSASALPQLTPSSSSQTAAAAQAPATSPLAASVAPVKLVLVVGVALLDVSCVPCKVLVAQRPQGKANAGMWEFPGGKVDPGESPEAALARELAEELHIQVSTCDLEPLTFASHAYPTFHLLMPLYVCRRWHGSPHGAEGQAIDWANARQLEHLLQEAVEAAAGECSGAVAAAVQAGRKVLTPADVPLVAPVLQAMARADASSTAAV